MKLLSMMSVGALLAVAAAALTRGAAVKDPELSSAFRSDTTLRFMHKHNHEVASQHFGAKEQAEASRSHLCQKHGFRASERAGCVAFMRQACQRSSGAATVPLKTCMNFFHSEQPGFGGEAAKLSKSKKGSEKQNENGPLDLDDWQEGPKYDSKKAQKATEKVADKNKEPRRNPVERAADNINDSFQDNLKDFQRGPNYNDKDAQKAKVSKKEKAAEGGIADAAADKGPEDEEVKSMPGCKNSDKGWKDSAGDDCEDYAEGEWCTRHGGYGDAWLDEWGTFEDRKNEGKSATDVCCVCGGGIRKGEEAAEGSDDKNEEVKEDKKEEDKKEEGEKAAVPAPEPPKGLILGGKPAKGALQEQGFTGKLVAHEDQKTMTSDWGAEFGPHAGHRSVKQICAEKQDNEWCSLHGYYDKEHSGASLQSMVAVLIPLLFACLR